ncbi:MAG TPA: restriction endonuclease subunit S [Methylophilaceae bacterium]|nr:restriction endonuclease subunit S [Methylophilaceae bacterium]
MKKLNELFDVTYGNKLDLNKMTPIAIKDGGVNFVGRSSQNHGISGTVALLDGIKPYEAGLITVSLGGTKLLSSFIQEGPFYTAQNVAVLKPKEPMTFAEKLYICLSIRHNRFRYSAFGREANRTLRYLLVPERNEFPAWVYEKHAVSTNNKPQISALDIPTPELNVPCWRNFRLQNLFDLRKGKRLTKADMTKGNIPFIGSTDSNNGVTARIGQDPIHTRGTITVSYNGSVAEAFYQPEDFWATDDVNVLYPKFKITPEIALFICTIIRQEKYRFNYGRKWHLERMRYHEIKLPAQPDGTPDFKFMELYIKSLPYSSQLS